MKAVKLISINIIILFFFIIIIEFFFGGWFFHANNLNNLNILRNVDLKLSVKNLYDNNGNDIHYSRDMYGLR